jgi:hypothetical protein
MFCLHFHPIRNTSSRHPDIPMRRKELERGEGQTNDDEMMKMIDDR